MYTNTLWRGNLPPTRSPNFLVGKPIQGYSFVRSGKGPPDQQKLADLLPFVGWDEDGGQVEQQNQLGSPPYEKQLPLEF